MDAVFQRNIKTGARCIGIRRYIDRDGGRFGGITTINNLAKLSNTRTIELLSKPAIGTQDVT